MDMGTGCVIGPDDTRDYPASILLGSEGNLPSAYIVPAFLHVFNSFYKPIKSEAMKVIRNQGGLPTCVGESTALQKQTQEGVKMSSKDCYRQAKRLDGSGDPLSWGTTLNAGQDAVVDGIATEAVVPFDRGEGMESLVSLDDVDEGTLRSREEHKGKSYFRVERNDFERVIYGTRTPIVTALQWYPSDHNIGPDGVMKWPTGSNPRGHAVTMAGWFTRDSGTLRRIFANSHGVEWGDNGFFYVDDDMINRFTSGRLAVDMPHDLAKLLVKWNEKNVKCASSPDIYRIQYGVRRKYENEIVFWSFGNLFVGGDAQTMVYDIPEDELYAIPEGIPMDIKDAPFRYKELVREIRQHYNQF